MTRRIFPFVTCTVLLCSGCLQPSSRGYEVVPIDSTVIEAEVERAVRAFHAADTSRNAEAVIDLLWPEYTMLADGSRLSYRDVADGSRDFMARLRLFHTVWTDLQIRVLSRDVAISSFLFRDSIVTNDDDVIRSRGPVTFVWQRRADEWRLIFADADHYSVE